MIDYSYYIVREIKDFSQLQFDLFISVFDGCDRTVNVFNKISAKKKYWMVLPQYHQEDKDKPSSYLYSDITEEEDYVYDVLEPLKIDAKCSICVDATGFIIPHLLFLVQYLKYKGITSFDIIYSEPLHYLNGEETLFAKCIDHTRPIAGYSTSAKDVNGEDTLIIFAGFVDDMVSIVAREKSKAKHKYLFTGFPPLQADMYQQNLIQLNKSKETIGERHVHYCMAPAYDPFIAAMKVQVIIDKIQRKKEPLNYIHIAPLSTKPMAIAAALVYFNNPCAPIDIIYPPASYYNCSYAVGLKRTWKYTIEL